MESPIFRYLVIGTLLLLGVLAGDLVAQWLLTGVVPFEGLTRLVLVAMGIAILARAGARRAPRPGVHRCSRCGGPTYETVRATDRRAFLTCFTCGAEFAPPTPGANPPAPPSPPEAGSPRSS